MHIVRYVFGGVFVAILECTNVDSKNVNGRLSATVKLSLTLVQTTMTPTSPQDSTIQGQTVTTLEANAASVSSLFWAIDILLFVNWLMTLF
jgi:hypothetical protein